VKGKLPGRTNLSKRVDTCSKCSSQNKGKSEDKRLKIMPTSALTLYQLPPTRTWRCRDKHYDGVLGLSQPPCVGQKLH